MNFEQLKSFEAIVKANSYSKAAKERFISQPAISNQMKSLEDELGVSLFLRDNKNVKLTEKGKILHEYAAGLLTTESIMRRKMESSDPAYFGILNIAVPYLIIDELLDDFFVKMIAEKKEEATLRLMQREEEDIPGQILSGEIQIGITNKKIDNKSLVYEKGFCEEIVLITPNQEKYRNLNQEQIRDLLLTEEHVRFDFGAGSDYLWNDFIGKAVERDLHNIRTAGRSSHYHQHLKAVEAGLGIAFISDICIQKYWREDRILVYRCKELLQKEHYVVYLRERAEDSELIRYTKDLLISELRKWKKIPEYSF